MHPNKTLEQMESYMEVIKASPADEGKVDMIVVRPKTLARNVLDRGELHAEHGLVGDNWSTRGDKHTPDGKADSGRQVTLMNSRAIQAITDDEERWPEAGDQFFVDFDLSVENLPPGSHLGIGEAVVEISPLPHLGCKKFGDRFGKDANRFVNSDAGKALNLRGVNARVVKAGPVAVGDTIRKLDPANGTQDNS